MDALWDGAKTEFAGAYRDLVAFLIAAAEALVVIAVATVVARALRRRTRQTLSSARMGANLAVLAANGVGIAVYVVAATFVLGLFGADWTALLAVLGVGTLAVSLALQDVLKNFVAGVYVLLERPFTIGDRIRLRDFEGEVEGIDIRTTVLRNARQERVLIPNATVFAEVIVNRSACRLRPASLRLENVTRPLDEVEGLVREGLGGLAGPGEPAPELVLRKVGEAGATVEVLFWHAADAPVARQAMARLRERFPEATVALSEE